MNLPLIRLAVATATLGIGMAHAHESDAPWNRPGQYRLVKLSDFGAAVNSGNSINNDKLIAGFADLNDGSNGRHAMLWLYGFRFDLGTLGGLNSNVAWPVKNRIGLIAGIAQTDIPEPLGQTWSCRSFFPFPTRSGFICSAVVWEEGKIRALPTLGGYNGFATGANNYRQVVGWAQNTVLDPSCNPVHVKQQFHAVMWGPGENQKRELLPLPGVDTTSAATAINDSGQVVGISGNCGTAVGGTSAREAVIWEKGKAVPQKIGNLGGIAWNTPMAINERGEVVGFSNISAASGAAPNWHAFYWSRNTGIKDLNALEGYPLSQALGINERGQIVGTSCTADFEVCRAVLWENGRMHDLNDLLTGTSDQLAAANDINADGHIAAQAFTPDTQVFSAAWVIPTPRTQDQDNSNAQAPSSSPSTARASPLPVAMRQALLEQFGLEQKHSSRSDSDGAAE
jgi:probable HAF family extracellular repeat protein